MPTYESCKIKIKISRIFLTIAIFTFIIGHSLGGRPHEAIYYDSFGGSSSRNDGLLSSVIARSMPALNINDRRNRRNCNQKTRLSNRENVINVSNITQKASTKEETKERKLFPPNFFSLPAAFKQPIGIYYGLAPDKIFGTTSVTKKKRLTMRDTMTETLEELRLMREEIHMLREEMSKLQTKLIVKNEDVDDLKDNDEIVLDGIILDGLNDAEKKRVIEYEKISKDVESWARKILFEEEKDDDPDKSETGWSYVPCNKMVNKKFNKDGRTKAYLKWAKDSRGEKYAGKNDPDKLYPMIAIYGTIDAPVEEVCEYLSQSSNLFEYNDLLINHRDIEEITSHSKIAWGISPQILFIKSREFITYCSYKWTNDGNTQIIVNQAADQPSDKGKEQNNAKDGNKLCDAYALRGANFISRDIDQPDKTQIAMLAHADPGGDIPQWAAKTAINTVAPIEPFKLMHKINANVQESKEQLQKRVTDFQLVNRDDQNGIMNKKRRPGGIAQMGYGCFWPCDITTTPSNIVEGGNNGDTHIINTNVTNIENESSIEQQQQQPVDQTPARKIVEITSIPQIEKDQQQQQNQQEIATPAVG